LKLVASAFSNSGLELTFFQTYTAE